MYSRIDSTSAIAWGDQTTSITDDAPLRLLVGDGLTAIELAKPLLYFRDEAQSFDRILDGGIIRKLLNRLNDSLLVSHVIDPPYDPPE